MKLPPSRARVAIHTADGAARRIRAETEARVARCAQRPSRIGPRLRELDREWDVERALEANASTLILVGVALGATVDRRWLALPAAVSAFLFQHAVQGWCPPLPVLRRLGFRTAVEIEAERHALMALRGDFEGIGGGGRAKYDVRATPQVRARRALEATSG